MICKRYLAWFLFASTALFGQAIEPADTVTLDEITITAFKQGALSELPSAVTTLNADQIDRLHIESVRGATDVVPNFFIPDYGSRITSSIYVRGIGARIDQPAVGLTIDNVPVLNKDAYDFDITDIAKMQVLRGPQSTLFGRNTMAGVVDITTLSPLHYQGLRASARYGKANTWRVAAGYYFLLIPNLGISATVQGGGSDGFFTNVYTQDKCDYEHTFATRVKAHWQPAAHLSLLNTFSLSFLKQGGYPYESVATGLINYNDTCAYRRLTMADGITVNWRVGHVEFVSATSWQYINDDMHLDQDFMPLPYFTLLQSKEENSFTQDFVAKASFGSIYSGLLGVFGFYKHLDMNAPVTFKDTGISELIEKYRNEANPYFPIRWIDRSFVLNSHFINPTYGLAIYHNSSVKLGAFKLSAAIRLDYERASLRYLSHTSTAYEILKLDQATDEYSHYRNVDIVIHETGRLHRSFLQLLPRLSVEYNHHAPTLDLMSYATIAKGYKSGGYNTQMFSDVLQQQLMWQMGIGMRYDVDQIVSYKPEKSWNYEMGVRLNFPATALQIEGNIFYIDVRDQQLTMFPDGTTTGRIMTNAGRTHSYGFEVSARYKPLESLSLNIAYGHTTARFRDFYNGREQFRGKTIPYAPENTLFASTAYTWPLQSGQSICLDVNVRANGKIYWNEANSLSQPFYALLGASLTYSHPKFSCELWASNLTNTKFHTFYFVSISHEFVQRGKPIDLGVTLNLAL